LAKEVTEYTGLSVSRLSGESFFSLLCEEFGTGGTEERM